MVNYLSIFKQGGIHIKKENKGKFTDYCGGTVTEECIQKGKRSSNPVTRKRATFADNARHFKHSNGGIVKLFKGGYKIDTNTTCDTTECATYSHQKLRDAGLLASGNAWNSQGKIIYNGWASTPVTDYNTHGVAAAQDLAQNFSSSKLDPKKVYEVNMYYLNSPAAYAAYPDIDKNGIRGTHTGNLYYDPDKDLWIVEHNIHGKVYREPWNDLLEQGKASGKWGITAIIEPRKNTMVNRLINFGQKVWRRLF